MNTRTARVFRHFDALREGVLQLLDMRDDQDLLKIVLDGLDDFDQLLPPLAVLGAEPFVQDQGLQLCAGAPRQQARQRDPNGKIDPKRLAAAEQFVGARAQIIRDLDLQRLALVPGRLCDLRRLESDVHRIVGDPTEETVRLLLQVGNGVLDNQRLHALASERGHQVVVEPALLIHTLMIGALLLGLRFGALTTGDGVAAGALAYAQVVASLLQPVQVRLRHGQRRLHLLVLRQLGRKRLAPGALRLPLLPPGRGDRLQSLPLRVLVADILLGIEQFALPVLRPFQALDLLEHRLMLGLGQPQLLQLFFQFHAVRALGLGKLAALQPGLQQPHLLSVRLYIGLLRAESIPPFDPLLMLAALHPQVVPAGFQTLRLLLNCREGLPCGDALPFETLLLLHQQRTLRLLLGNHGGVLLAAQVALADRAGGLRASQQLQHLVQIRQLGLAPLVPRAERLERLLRLLHPRLRLLQRLHNPRLRLQLLGQRGNLKRQLLALQAPLLDLALLALQNAQVPMETLLLRIDGPDDGIELGVFAVELLDQRIELLPPPPVLLQALPVTQDRIALIQNGLDRFQPLDLSAELLLPQEHVRLQAVLALLGIRQLLGQCVQLAAPFPQLYGRALLLLDLRVGLRNRADQLLPLRLELGQTTGFGVQEADLPL